MSLYLCIALPFKHSDTKTSLQTLGLRLQRYTPQLCLLHEHALLLSIHASLALFGGPLRLWRSIQTDIAATTSLPCNSALAPSAWGAYFLALSPTPARRCLQWGRLHRLLDALPVSLLALGPTQQNWLHELACHQFSQLRALPRAGLAQRGLHESLRLLDQAYGKEHSVFNWLAASVHFEHRQELDHSTRQSSVLLHVLEQLLQKLLIWLHQRQLACDQLSLQLHHDARQFPASTLDIQLARSSYRMEDFLPVLQERIRQYTMLKPVYAVSLLVTHTHPRSARSASLLPDDPHTLQAQEQLLMDKLAARLGPQALQYPQARHSSIPEQANHWQAYSHHTLHTLEQHAKIQPAVRPYWLLKPAIALTTQGHRPCLHGQALHLFQGPERIQSGWWSQEGHEQRDYYIAHDAQQRRYWIYRLLKQADAWFLHGVFG